jgi:type IV pilus assembly protein PilQ
MDQRQAVTETFRPVGAPRITMAAAAAFVLLAGTTQGLAQSSSLKDLASSVFSGGSDQPEIEGAGGAIPAEFEEPEFFEGELDETGGLDVSVDKYDLVDLHVNDEDLGRVLQLLSIQSERNIVASNSVAATITADLYGVTFYEALDAILHVNGYGYIEQGNFIHVYTREELLAIEQATRERVTKVYRLDYLNAVDAAEFVQQLLSENGVIKTSAAAETFNIDDSNPVGADTFANEATLVITDYEENVDSILDLLEQLDTRPVQVLVEATILQTSLTEDNAFGVDFSVLGNLEFADFAGIGGPLAAAGQLVKGVGQDISGGDIDISQVNNTTGAVTSSVGNVSGDAGIRGGIVTDDVAVFLRLLDEVTDVTVVSNPKILTLNRQPARVLVGTRVGYLNTTTTETSTTQTVEFLDTGTQLALRPFVAANGLIRLELKPQVSNFTLRETTGSNGSPVTIPDEETTELVTNVMVRDGQTVVLGGLFTETTTATRRQVPVLGDIPVIGAAFRGHEDNTRRSEIIFMITPSIVNDAELTQAGELGTEYLATARAGAREGLLKFSRERRVSQLLIKAREYHADGHTEKAIFCLDRALTLHPRSTEARKMLVELRGTQTVVPSNSILDSVWGKEFHVAPTNVPNSMGEINVDAGQTAPAPIEDVVSVNTGGQEQGFEVSGKTGADAGMNPYVEPVADIAPQNGEAFEGETSSWAGEGVNPAFVEDVTEVVEFEDASGIGFDRTAPEPEIDLEFETPDEGSFFDGESVTQAETGEAQASGVNESFVEYVEDVTPVESFNRSAPEALVDLNDGFAEADGSEAFFQEEISTPEAPDPSFIESISGVSTPTEMFFEEQTGGRQASAGQGVNFFENPKIDGLEFDNQSGAMLEWGQPQATGPVLGPVLAPAGAEVLWIPIPNGQMLRIPLTGSGTFQVYERGYPLDDTFVNVPTSGSVQDEIND